MQITEVNVTPINNEKKLKGFASIVFDNCFVVSDIKIIETPRAAFLSMPSKKASNGKFRDVAHPLNAETRQMIEDHVFDAYEQLTGQKLCREGDEGAFDDVAEPVVAAAEEDGHATVRSDFDSADEPDDSEEEHTIEPSDILSVKEFGF